MRRRTMLATGLALPVALSTACSSTRRDTPGQASSTDASPTAYPTSSYAMRPKVPQAVPGTVMLGAYLDLQGLSQAQSLALRRKQLGRDPRIIHWFYRWEDLLPASYQTVPNRAVIMLSWQGTLYDQVLNGSQDQHIAACARSLARYRKPIFLRWAWEMNGHWYAWGGAKNGQKPQAFVAAWRRIYGIFQAQGASNVGWVWAPNYRSNPDQTWNYMNNYYPGDQYVDWVGVSGYSDAAISTPEALFDVVYEAYASRKPVMITETGIRKTGSRQAADWLDRLSQWFVKRPGACALVWFDTDTHHRGRNAFTNFRIDRDPALLDAYRRMAADPRFNG